MFDIDLAAKGSARQIPAKPASEAFEALPFNRHQRRVRPSSATMPKCEIAFRIYERSSRLRPPPPPAGMLCTWHSHTAAEDPLDIKLALDVDIPKHYLEQITALFDYVAEGQLMYPFIGLRYRSSNLAEVIQQEAVALGRLLAGGLDHESDETMRSYVAQSLSHRRYEGLFLQGGGGIGVYTSGTEADPQEDVVLYERTLFRAVQICELCLIEQRLLRTFRRKVDQDAKKVQLFPRPLLVEKHREELLELENQMVKTLPFRSTEAEPLLRKAQEIFQIPAFLRDAKDSYDFLEKRYQNTKTTALAILAVATYILDKLKLWDKLASLWHHP